MKMDRNRAGLSVGSLFGLMHLLWVLAFWFGMGQPLADIVFSAHFLTNGNTIMSVSLGMAVFSVIGVFIVGYVTGWVFSLLWNLFGKR